MLLNGKVMDEVDERGRPIKDDVLLILVNSYWEPIKYALPDGAKKLKWELVLDTSNPKESFHDKSLEQNSLTLNSRSLVMLRQIED